MRHLWVKLKERHKKWVEKKNITTQRALEIADAKERAQIAQLFNNRYAYCVPYVNDRREIGPGVGIFGIPYRRGYRWMCPDCNRIHEPSSGETFTGLWYPACCSFREFYRQGNGPGLVPNKLLYKKVPHHRVAKPIPFEIEESK